VIEHPNAQKNYKNGIQPRFAVTYPPRLGAIMVEMPSTNMSIANAFALSLTGNKSLTNATAATVAAQLPKSLNKAKRD